eukprot:m.436521 g.436521  ORF g.436521 m.436521 type:complete len:216 (+) comp17987_c0_seq1:247-894(+)
MPGPQGPHKILVIGEPGIGKTSLIRRYVDNVFDKNYTATLGVDFALKVVPWDNNMQIQLQLWDIAGQERFSSMTRVYYKQATACVIIFDITRLPTLKAVARWKNDLDGKASLPNGDPIPCLLVANKCDLAERPIPKEDIQQLCDEHGFIGWIETSAKEDVNVSKAMRYLIEHILYLHEDDDEGSAPAGSTKGANTVSLETAGDPKPKKADCCGGK